MQQEEEEEVTIKIIVHQAVQRAERVRGVVPTLMELIMQQQQLLIQVQEEEEELDYLVTVVQVKMEVQE